MTNYDMKRACNITHTYNLTYIAYILLTLSDTYYDKSTQIYNLTDAARTLLSLSDAHFMTNHAMERASNITQNVASTLLSPSDAHVFTQ